jgi:3-dehydroquinate synthase
MSEIVKVNLNRKSHQYKISVGNDLLKNCGVWAKNCLPETTQKIAIISNPKVFSLFGEIVVQSLKNEGFEVSVWQMGDGERYKSLRSFEKALAFFSANKLKRSDAVVALGGGVVGDLTGFAAAAYLRGIDFLQIPTTLLSMIDSSVGGKTGVNSSFGKNLIGAFHQPHGVLIDVNTLKTLPRRELTAGFCEAIKQGAIANQQLFNQTRTFLENYSTNNFKKYFYNSEFLNDLQKLIAAQVAFKAEIVRGDEQENAHRTDSRSRKILNFGHTVAHALEKITDYKYFKHGEAVGYGILVAAEISKNIGIFDKDGLQSLNDVIRLVGKLPSTKNIEISKVIEAFIFDKKNLGQSLQWILLEKIGQPKILSAKDIPPSIIEQSIKAKIEHKSYP